MNELMNEIFQVAILVDGKRLPIYDHEGRWFVEATLGKEFVVEVTNRDSRRIEALMSIDGRNVLKDEPANLRNSGMVIDGYGQWVNRGWRIDNNSVRKFIFSNPEDSIAQKATGSARNIGVIGIAAYPERRHFNNWIAKEMPSLPWGDSLTLDSVMEDNPIYRKGGMFETPSVSNFASQSRSTSASVGTGIGKQVKDEVGTTVFERDTFYPVRSIEIQYRPYAWLMAHGVIKNEYPSSGYGQTGYGKY